jgi:hypothetical protein
MAVGTADIALRDLAHHRFDAVPTGQQYSDISCLVTIVAVVKVQHEDVIVPTVDAGMGVQVLSNCCMLLCSQLVPSGST